MQLIDKDRLLNEIAKSQPQYRTDVERLIKEAPVIDPYKYVYDVILDRYEEEAHRAYSQPEVGLKEHAVWIKAIRILEEYIES